MRNRYIFAAILVVAILVENYAQPGFVAIGWNWTIGWLPYGYQTIVAAIIAAILFVLIRTLGWIALLALVVIALWPLTGIRLGEIDNILNDIARWFASNQRDPYEVGQIFTWLHYGLIGVLALVVGLLLRKLRRDFPMHY